MSIVEKAVDKHLRKKQHQRGHFAGKRNDGTEPLPPLERPVLSDFAARYDDDNEPSLSLGSEQAVLHLDYDSLRDAGIVPPEEMAPDLADEFRRIKRPLLANAFGKGVVAVDNGNLIMLSSALAGEGKTFTATNLAMSVATERERTVLLVDADVAKPHISTALGLSNRRGLMDALLDESLDIGDMIVQSDMPSLRILPAGQKHRHATELLASETMERLVMELAGRYHDRVIIFDSPPLLQTSEAQVLASLMGQVVLVVHAGSTPQNAVQTALSMIDPSKAVNLVLNKSHLSTTPGYGYYPYGQE